jgi:hypothetical protein
MQLAWRIVDALLAGSFGMFVVQSATFVVGVYLVLSRMLDARRAAWLAVAILLYPPVMTVMAVVWKDSIMAGLMMLGAGLVLRSSRRARVAGLALIGLGAAMRYNGFAAAVPLIALAFEWRAGMAPLARYAIASALAIAVALAGAAANVALTDREVHYWHSSLAVMDLAGIVRYAEPIPDDELRRELAGTRLLVDRDIAATLARQYSSRIYRTVLPSWDLPFDGVPPPPPEQRDAIERAWWSLVRAHPCAYLHHRVHVFRGVLGMFTRTWGRVHDAPEHASALQQAWTVAARWLSDWTPLYWPWAYLIVALALVYVRRRDRVALALLASGLVLESSLFFLAPSPDYRYSHWMIVCTCIALATRRRPPRS